MKDNEETIMSKELFGEKLLQYLNENYPQGCGGIECKNCVF